MDKAEMKRRLYLMASTSALALALAATPVTVDFDLDKPVLNVPSLNGINSPNSSCSYSSIELKVSLRSGVY